MTSKDYNLIHGLAEDLIKDVKDDSVDLILTDPPYNIGENSRGNILFKERKDFNQSIAEWDKGQFDPKDYSEEFIRVLKPTGNLIIFSNYNQMGKWYDLLDHRFDTFYFAVWHKNNPSPQVRKKSWLSSCELIIACWNRGHTWNFTTQKGMHNFFEYPVCAGKERKDHPTQKPLELIRELLLLTTNTGDFVLDPFTGTATSGVAALQEGRDFLGFEVEEKYCEIARERLSDAKSQDRLIYL